MLYNKNISYYTPVKLFFTIILLFAFFACSIKSDKQKALEYLKANREIRSGYDGKDSLVTILKAKYKELKKEDNLRKNYQENDIKNKALLRILIDSIQNLKYSHAEKVTDVNVVIDSYLESHLDWAMQTWQSKWCKHLTYDEFRSFILSYRVIDEPFEDWRAILSKQYPWLLKFDKDKTSLFDAVCIIHDSCKLYQNFFPGFDKIRTLRVSEMIDFGVGNCINRTIFATYMLRTAGIPVAVAFNREGHNWNVFIDTDNKWYSFDGCGNNPKRITPTYGRAIKTTKAFLRTLHPSNHELSLLKEQYLQNTPTDFSKFFCDDITAKVIPASNVDIPIVNKNNINKNTPIFLCACKNREQTWFPLDFTIEQNRSVVSLSNVGNDELYVLATYANREFATVSHPFFIDSVGNVKEFIPDSTVKNSVTLYRKTDLYGRGQKFARELIGAKIYASNDKNFKNCELLHTIDTIYEYYNGKNFNTNSSFRYYKVKGTEKQLNVYKFSIFDKTGKKSVKAIYPENRINFMQKYLKEKSEAKLILSYPVDSFIIDAGEKIAPASFKVLTRNDFNLIENGEPYKLFQWNDNGWIEVDEKTGNNDCITFSNLPSNTLFYVAHPKIGEESTLFWVENNTVRWSIQNDFE